MTKFRGFWLIVVVVTFQSPISLLAQSYDQLKMQLQFENYYGTRMKSNPKNDNFSGSEYLFEEWVPIEVTFEQGSAKFDQGKLNLLNSGVEVVYKGKEMFISPTNFHSVKLLNQNRKFVPGNKYFYNDLVLVGMVEVFVEELTAPFVLQQHFIYVKEPSSNGYVNGGNSERRRVKSSALFIHDGTKLIPVKGRKSLEKFYKDNKVTFEEVSKKLDTNYKEGSSVQALVDAIQAALKGNS